LSKSFIYFKKSGFYCRFLIPHDLQVVFNRRYVVRALHTSNGNHGRLLAALLAIRIQHIFDLVREGHVMDLQSLLAQLRPGSIARWEAGKVTLPNGALLENINIQDDEDQQRFNSAVVNIGSLAGMLAPSSSKHDKGGLLVDRINQYLAERKRGELSQKNLNDAEFALRYLLVGLCGNKFVNDVGHEDADRVMNALMCWPANARKKSAFKNLSVSEIIQKAKEINAAQLAPRTVEKYLDRLRVFFTWCYNRDYLIGKNPFSQRRLMGKDNRQSKQKKQFEGDELKLIFSPEMRKVCNEPHKFWCPLIALFSGARLNEIAQLYLDDIYQSGNVWLFKIEADKPDKKIKNKASERAVPIHEKLIELGFLEYVNDLKLLGFTRLFPNLPFSALNGYGDAVGDWFNGRFLRHGPVGSKVQRVGISDPEKSFHSFRYTVINRLYAVVADRLAIAEITGHERGEDVLTNVYLESSTAQRRALYLNQLQYPFLKFSPYFKGQFDGFFRRLLRKQALENIQSKVLT
jgi:integrase